MPEKLHRCVSHVKAQGKSDDSAWAICNDSIKEFSIYEISSIRETLDPNKIDKVWSQMTSTQRGQLLRENNIDASLSRTSFDNLPLDVRNTLSDITKAELLSSLNVILSGALLGLSIAILDAPAEEPISQIKDRVKRQTTSTTSIDNDELLVLPSGTEDTRSFTHSSSWIGNVRYNSETKQMRVLMNGKAYLHCGVEQIDFDRFEGAPSKGEHWWREIKDRFNCGGFSETTNNADMMDWPPTKLEYPDVVDVLMINYSPDTGRPDGITPDEKTLQTQPQPTGKPYTYPNVHEAGEWDEDKHPRDEDGKFTSGSQRVLTDLKDNTPQQDKFIPNPMAKQVLGKDGKFVNLGVLQSEDQWIEHSDFLVPYMDKLDFESTGDAYSDKSNAFISFLDDTNSFRVIASKYNTFGVSMRQKPTQAQLKTVRDIDSQGVEVSYDMYINGISKSGTGFRNLVSDLSQISPINESIQGSACGNCRFYVDGGSCALVKGAIDPVHGICKFYEGGTPLAYNTQVFPIYEKIEAEYKVMPYEPYLQETSVSNVIDREHELLDDGIPENEVHDILKKEFPDDVGMVESLAIPSSLSNVSNRAVKTSYLDMVGVGKHQETNEDPYTATGAKINSEPSMHNEEGHQQTNPQIMDYQNENPDPDALIFDFPPHYNNKRLTQESIRIRETIGELSQQFNWMTDDYLSRVSELGKSIGGRFVLVRASAEAITDHRAEGEPYRRLLKGDELAQLTRTGKDKTTDINHLGTAYAVDSDVLDAEYDPIRKESQMLVHLRDPEIIDAIETGMIQSVSINAGLPRHMDTECDMQECYVVPRGLYLGELDGIAFTWVVDNPQGMNWKGQYISPATPGVKTTKIELL